MRQMKLKSGSMMLYVGILLAVLLLMFMLKKCSAENIQTDDARAQGDTLNVAIELSPLGISMSEDTLSGFHYDLIRAIAARHGRRLQISGFATPASALEQLENGRYDILISDIPVTKDLKDRFIVTDPIYLDKQVLVRRHTNDSLPFTQYSLAGDTVWVASGSSFARRLQNLAEEMGDTIYVMEDPDYGAEQLAMLTAIGEIKQAVLNQGQAVKMKERYPQLDISTPISFNQFQGWVLTTENIALRDSINSWLSEFKETPDYKELQKRYLKN